MRPDSLDAAVPDRGLVAEPAGKASLPDVQPGPSRRRAWLGVLSPIVVATAAVAVTVVLLQQRNAAEEQALVANFQKHQLAIAQGLATSVEGVFTDLRQAMQAVAQMSDVVDRTPRLQEALNSVYGVRSDILNGVSLLDVNGRMVLRGPQLDTPYDASSWPEFRQAIETRRPVIGDPTDSAVFAGRKVVRILAPVEKDGQLRGVVSAAIGYDKLWAKCLARVQAGRGNFCWVVDSSGLILYDDDRTHLYRTFADIEADPHHGGGDNLLEEAAEAAVRARVQGGEEGVACLRTDDIHGTEGAVDQLIAFTSIHIVNKRYGLAVVVPKSEITGCMASQMNLTVGIIVGLVSLLGVAGYLTIRSGRAIWLLQQERQLAGERQRGAEQLRQAIEHAEHMAMEAQSASIAKSEFLANMSHEIRTPLTAILGYADLLREDIGRADQQEQHVRVIRRNGEHLLGLINDILDLSKIEAGRLVLDPQACCPQLLVADVVSLMRVRAAQKGLSLAVRYGTPVPETVLLDEVRLRQCLINLVGNAIKFTEAGGVVVEVRCTPGAEAALCFDVTDTGIGIDADAQKGLFRPFVQADSSTSRKYGGTGLGLTITQRLVEMMGGGVTVRSAAGQGSTFSIRIPVTLEGTRMIESPREATSVDRDDDSSLAKQPLAGVRILLAEDGPDNRLLIHVLLERAGARVTLAENGREAVERAMVEALDLILMDMQMPEVDGYQATGELRNRGLTLPIVALTAHALADDRERCLAAGCTDYVTKPIDRQTLIEMVLRHTAAAAVRGPGLLSAGHEVDRQPQVLSANRL